MASITDYIVDTALAKIKTETNRMDFCSSEPKTFTEATSTYSLGNKVGISIGNPAQRLPNGRKITVVAVTDGNVTKTGTAKYWALTNTSTSKLVATGSLSVTQSVVIGNTFKTVDFDISIPAAV